MSRKPARRKPPRVPDPVRGFDAAVLYAVLAITIGVLPIIQHSGLFLALNGALQVAVVAYVVWRAFAGRRPKK